MKLLLFANTDWYLYNFRRSLALALRDGGHQVLLVSPPGPYGARLQALGLRWVPAPMRRSSVNPLRELSLLLWLWRLVRREAVDVVHGFTIKSAVYGALVARCVRPVEGGSGGVARVVAVAGMGYVFTGDTPRARLLRPVVLALFRAALAGSRARLVLQNADDAAMFQRAGLVGDDKLRMIAGSGVDCTRFAPAAAAAASGRAADAEDTVDTVEDGAGSRLRVLLPARILWDKGVAEFAEAARRLQVHGSFEFLLAGAPDPGNPTAVPEQTLRDWEAEGLLRWLGHVEDMPALLRSVQVVALPSYREGLPRSLIEAAACGLALVTADVPGCRHVVTDGVDGLLVPPQDAVGLANALLRLQRDPALRQRLGAAARRRAVQEFDERIVVRKTLDVYAELVGPIATPTAPQRSAATGRP